nr:MAG TPA: hypothetical protein [Caudoviricetes sp.]
MLMRQKALKSKQRHIFIKTSLRRGFLLLGDR